MLTERRPLVKPADAMAVDHDPELLEALIRVADPHAPPTEDEILSLILGELTKGCGLSAPGPNGQA